MADEPSPFATPEAQQAAAVVHDLAEATLPQKKEMVVDHALVMSEVQLLLAEKRTSFALMRTGVTVSLVPLSVWSVLIATSSLWSIWDVWWLVIPIGVVTLAFFTLGALLIFNAMDHLAHTDKVMLGLRQSDTLLEDLLIEHGRADFLVKPWRWGKLGQH